MQQKEKWYQKTIWIVILLIVFFPVGLFLMWKYSDWGKWMKIGLTVFLALTFISTLLDGGSNSNSSATTSDHVQPQLVKDEVPIEKEAPKTTLEKIKDKKKNAEISIDGSVLYIRENMKRSKRAYYHTEAKEVYNDIHDLIEELPQDVTTICVWYDTEFIDNLGHESTDTVYRINMPLDTLKSINWDNYIGLDFEGLSNGDMYAWQGLK